jgi:hypothetical protein
MVASTSTIELGWVAVDDGRGQDSGPSRAFTDLLLSLSAALLKHSMYPPAHPALQHIASGLADRAATLLQERSELSVGVARHQLIIDGAVTDAGNPALRRLADCLHGHHLAGLTWLRGVDAAQIGGVLSALAVEPATSRPLGLLTGDALPSWPHIRLHPLNFDHLTIVDGGAGESVPDGRPGHQDLWKALAEAALAGALGPAGAEPGEHTTAPDQLARAIDARGNGGAYDQAVSSCLRQIMQALRHSSGADAEVLKARTSGLIAALQPDTLRRLVRTSRADPATRGFVQDAVQSLRVDAVLEVIKATADVSGETISHGLLRMLTKLAAHADGRGRGRLGAGADEALRGQVSQLLADWSLADPNPDSYGRLLQQLATTVTLDEPAAPDADDVPPSLRLVQMGFELGSLGTLGDRALARQVADGDLGALMAVLDAPPPGSEALVETVRARLRTPAVLTRLLSKEPVNFAALDALLPTMSAAEHEPLLDVLASSDNRTLRRRLIDRLAEVPHDLSAMIIARLDDPRWHVQRNMLLLLERTGRVPAGFRVAAWTAHADRRVRHEAIRLALTLPGERPAAIRAALNDSEPRALLLGLAALGTHCPPDLVGRIAAIATDADLPDDARVAAVTTLERAGPDTAQRTFVALVHGGRTLLGRAKLAAPSPVVLAALKGLARQPVLDSRARRYLSLAQTSAHAEVRAAVSGS